MTNKLLWLILHRILESVSAYPAITVWPTLTIIGAMVSSCICIAVVLALSIRGLRSLRSLVFLFDFVCLSQTLPLVYTVHLHLIWVKCVPVNQIVSISIAVIISRRFIFPLQFSSRKYFSIAFCIMQVLNMKPLCFSSNNSFKKL